MSGLTVDEIKIRDTIVHILDSMSGVAVLSDSILQYNSDFSDFLKEHIYKVITSDEAKKCQFVKDESEVYDILTSEKDFVALSRKLADKLYGILNMNIDIPAADLIVTSFDIENVPYLALLKMNYKESYMHQTKSSEDSNVNNIVTYRAMLPSKSQKLTEAAIINLNDYSIRLLEKKYDVNGQKTNYLSQLFLVCTTNLSQKAKLTIIEKAIESVQKDFFPESEQYEEQMKVKNVINENLEEHGQINIDDLSSKVFGSKVNLREAFYEKLDKHNISEKESITPTNKSTIKKYDTQKLTTDTGIEIKIPMEQYRNKDSIEFTNNLDGTTSIIIKNISKITSK